MILDPSEMKNPLDELAVSGLCYLPTRVEPLRNRFTKHCARIICITIQALPRTILNLDPLSRVSGPIGPTNSDFWPHSVQPDTLGCVLRCEKKGSNTSHAVDGLLIGRIVCGSVDVGVYSLIYTDSKKTQVRFLPALLTSKHITKVERFCARISQRQFMQAALKTGAEGKTDLVDTDKGLGRAIKDDERFLIMILYINRQGMKPGKRLLDRVSLRSNDSYELNLNRKMK